MKQIRLYNFFLNPPAALERPVYFISISSALIKELDEKPIANTIEPVTKLRLIKKFPESFASAVKEYSGAVESQHSTTPAAFKALRKNKGRGDLTAYGQLMDIIYTF